MESKAVGNVRALGNGKQALKQQLNIVMREKMVADDGTLQRKARVLASKTFDRALEGEPWANQIIWERLMPKQSLAEELASAQGGLSIVINRLYVGQGDEASELVDVTDSASSSVTEQG